MGWAGSNWDSGAFPELIPDKSTQTPSCLQCCLSAKLPHQVYFPSEPCHHNKPGPSTPDQALIRVC